MKITAGKIFECFVFLPTLGLSWIETNEGSIYSLSAAWLLWYIEIKL